MAVPVCGPKLSMCCLLISVWGVIMLGLLGVFFRIRCPALVEDLPINEEKWEEEGHSYSYIEGLYEQASNNCFIAAGLYGGTFLLSLVMWTVNKRSDYTMH